jgi:NAD-dependent dihydropyrimidine dehydrogenase PreA subunit
VTALPSTFASVFAAVLGAVAALATAGFLLARWREQRRAHRLLADAATRDADLPASLHPVIDPDVCIGSGSCVSACPEGDILGLLDGAGRLLHPDRCVGHGRCAAECPVGAIKLVAGTAMRGVDLPEVDEHFESSRPGVHIVGELAGMGQLRQALLQGLEVADHLGRASSRRSRAERSAAAGLLDVVVVGAGPAGLATAAGCRAAGLGCVVIEQDTLGGSLAHFPRDRIVMTEPVVLPYHGRFGRPRMHKEELLVETQALVRAAQIEVREHTKLTGIEGGPDDFTITTSSKTLRARRVVLAVGRRTSPGRIGEFLTGLGVSLCRPPSSVAVAGGEPPRARTLQPALVLFLLGGALAAGLAFVGRHYYPLPQAQRYGSADHALLKPSGPWGHTVGIAATLFALSNFAYAIRKRVRRLKGSSELAPWLRFHVFVGLMCPLTVLFHAAFQWQNQLATTTYLSLLVLVGTGVVGRYVYGYLRLDPALRRRIDTLRQSLRPEMARLQTRTGGDSGLAAALARVSALIDGDVRTHRLLLAAFWGVVTEHIRLLAALRRLQDLHDPGRDHQALARQVLELRGLRAKVQLHAQLKRFMSLWRILHVVLALVLLALVAMHVWISVKVGTRWPWS